MTKSDLRQWARAQRRTAAAGASERICRALPPLLAGRSTVYAYAPDARRGELGLWPAWHALCAQGVQIALPRALPGRRMAFHLWRPGDPLLPDPRWGLLEPSPDAPPAGPSDAIVLPGLAASPQGVRLGYGGGFYDALLARAPDALRVFALLSACLRPALTPEPHDEPVDLLVTERMVLWTRARGCSVQPFGPDAVRPPQPTA
jgi:5-formyltetrahydrofolate cyclo-ligase